MELVISDRVEKEGELGFFSKIGDLYGAWIVKVRHAYPYTNPIRGWDNATLLFVEDEGIALVGAVWDPLVARRAIEEKGLIPHFGYRVS